MIDALRELKKNDWNAILLFEALEEIVDPE